MKTALLYTDLKGQLLNKTVNEATDIACISGSVPEGWQAGNNSDLLIARDGDWLDVATKHLDRVAFANVIDVNQKPYKFCPRTVACQTDAYAQSIGWDLKIGIEIEFHVFRNFIATTSPFENRLTIEGVDGFFHAGGGIAGRQLLGATRDSVLGSDGFIDLRNRVVARLSKIGVQVAGHGHETGLCQNELSLEPQGLVASADAIQICKWIIKEEAAATGNYATFFPRPISNDIGSGLHVNVSAWDLETNLFSGVSAGYSDIAYAFGAGILEHFRALCAICNPLPNSYSRLLNSFNLQESTTIGLGNRNSVLRLPCATQPSDCRLEVRFPDPSANPYLALSSVVLAGLSAATIPPNLTTAAKFISNTKLYASHLPVCLHEAACCLEESPDFLFQGNAFDEQLVRRYSEMTKQTFFRSQRHPNAAEFGLGYAV